MKRPSRVELGRVRVFPAGRTRRIVDTSAFARVSRPNGPLSEFLEGLPDILAVQRLRVLAADIVRAAKHERPVLWMLGAHVVKCGLSPLLIDLMEEGAITAVALNGAGAIHDFELALLGRTSEDVAESLAAGTFGFARETGEEMNRAISEGARQGRGLGESLGRALGLLKAPNRRASLLYRAWRMHLPLTVHVAIGTDIIHQHPTADGAAIGKTTFDDFRLLAGVVRGLEGGVVLNIGSAVLLPEAFLKAVSIARNLGKRMPRFTAANLDQIQHYRPTENVLRRPTLHGGKALSLTGHHEIMVPLLAATIKMMMARRAARGPGSRSRQSG
jgi:hypothetical protein